MTATAVPAEMTYIRLHGHGGPEVLEPDRMAVPSPGPGEVLVRVAAAGVNRPDVEQRRGNYPPPPGASDVPGLEIAGTIVAVGEGVAPARMGEEVCALVHSGGYAEYCVASDPLALPVPKGFSMVQAAAVPETFFTVWTNVFDRGRLAPGETLLVHGGSSGIGTTAIQLAKAFGSRVVVTVGNALKADACLKLGADRTINYNTEDFVEEVKAFTGGKGPDLILDMVGGSYIPRNIRCAAPGGRIVQIGFLESPKVEINFAPLMVKRLTYTGSTLRPRSVAEKAEIAEALSAKVWPLLEAGTVGPVIHTVLSLAEAAEAHRLMEESRHIGKIMLETEP
ncbi:MAG: NAD(P)H-quinone oxidoreductase [Rhodospirillaceae bacterium]|nr:NAD(P)H-quinone oxidoreductase [Rhodospirillaceae bacterium]MCA8933278.1 NAD(P)H-quinone oxidoreductase [Rhodospirillaceae bacterium]